MPRLKSIFIFALFIFSAVINSSVQIKETGILITVFDQFGNAIENAEIILNKSNEKQSRLVTNKVGVAEFHKLSAGEYQVIVSVQGFKEYKSQNIIVKTDEVQKIEVILEIASIESNVVITENEDVSAEKSGMTTVLTEKEIENLPDDPQELERMIKRIGESVAGEDLTISVNGVQGAKLPPKQAIQQIRVNQNVFSAQYDGPYGGGIEVFTRAGVDKVKGYLSFSFADSRLNAADPFIGKRVPYQSKSFYGSLYGPLFGKKANYFISGSHSEVDSSAVVNAVILNSSLQPAAFQQSFATPIRGENIYLNLNADPTKKHKLYFSYNLGLSRAEGQNVGGFSLPSRANKTRLQNHYFQFSDTYLYNANIVNQTRLLVNYNSTDNFGSSSDAAAVNVLDAFFGGGSQSDLMNKNLRFDAANETTWQMGKYGMGFGVQIRGEKINQNSRSNFGGTYTFGGRLAPVLDVDNNPVPDNAGNLTTTQISSLESYRRTLLFQQRGFTNQRIRELGGGASQFTISGGNPEIGVSQYTYAFYFQNSYKLTETVAASFGARYENQTNIDSNFNVAPRIGIIWAPKAKEKQKPLTILPRISFGYGIFYTRFELNNTLTVRQASDPDRAQYLITDSNILDNYPAVPSVALLQQFALPRNQRFIDDGLQSPYQSLATLTVAKKMPKGFTLNFTLSRSKLLRQSFTQNINAPLAGTYSLLNPLSAVRPFGNVGNIYQTDSTGRGENTRFSFNLGFPNSEKLYGSLGYNFTKAKSSVVSGSGSPLDPFDFSQEYGPTQFDGVHRLYAYLSYELPYDFYISNDFSIGSGTRFNIFTGRDTNGDGYFSERPSFAADLSKPNLISTPYGVLDPNPLPTDKLIPRNLGRGPRYFNYNVYMSKSFAFGEDKKNKKPPKRTLEFSASIRNAFNIINKGTPVGNMSSPNFLQSLSGGAGSSIYINNGLQQISFPGRNMNFSISFGF